MVNTTRLSIISSALSLTPLISNSGIGAGVGANLNRSSKKDRKTANVESSSLCDVTDSGHRSERTFFYLLPQLGFRHWAFYLRVTQYKNERLFLE